jgi:hypothetical protein
LDEAIAELDLNELQAVIPPRGFGREAKMRRDNRQWQ